MIDETDGYVLMDFEGKPVTIEDGKKYYWDVDDDWHWNSETCQFEENEEDEDCWDCDDEDIGSRFVGSGFARLYGMGWYDIR